MKERPILFSSEMVLAILEGRKTQTRRVMKPQPEVDGDYMTWRDRRGLLSGAPKSKRGEWPGWWFSGPYGLVGDRLWVKETWQAYTPDGLAYSSLTKAQKSEAELFNWAVVDKATSPELKREGDPWIPSIFMPRWASRLMLEITDVRVERVQDISVDDIKAEGVYPGIQAAIENWKAASIRSDNYQYYQDFKWLWDSINAKRGCEWDANPFVWVIEFRRVEG